MGIGRDWSHYLLRPLADALLARRSNSKALARHALDFPGVLDAARCGADIAAAYGFEVDEAWMERFALGPALDRQDVFSTLMGRSIVTEARLAVAGRWPAGQFMALGLHWGAGFPVLGHLEADGRHPAFVYRPENPDALDTLPRRLKNRLHMRALHGFGGCIPVGGAYQKIAATLSAGRVPVALFDAPAERDARTIDVHLDGYQVTLRTGLFRLLASQAVPYVFYRCGQNPAAEADGTVRLLEISSAAQSDDVEEIAQQAAAFLLDTLRHDAAQWHFWPHADVLIRADGL